MAALKEHRAPLTDVSEVCKVHRKNCLILISETEIGTNDRICLTVGVLWLATERQHTGKALSKHSPALVLPSLCLCFPFSGGHVLSLWERLVETSIWTCLMGGGEQEQVVWFPFKKQSEENKQQNTTPHALAPLLPKTETFKRLFPVPMGKSHPDPCPLQDKHALLSPPASCHI